MTLIGQVQNIVAPEGIQEMETVELGGAKQWISIRGLNRENPVILFIHGGPGSPAMPEAWAFQKPWEDFFTVVQWDQRGAGKNWSHTDPDKLAPTMTYEQLVADAIELVAYLRKKLAKDKIIVMGWSYGSEIGVEVAKQKPEWISVYAGIGQIGFRNGAEEYIHTQLVRMAKQENNVEALAELEAVLPYPNYEVKNDLQHVSVVRKWVRYYNCGWYGVRDLKTMNDMLALSPEYEGVSVADLEASSAWFVNHIVDNGGLSILKRQEHPRSDVFKVPVVLLMGRYDLQTPLKIAKQYFDALTAPSKKLVVFERGAHFPMVEQPGLFLKTLLDEVLPHTEGAATFEKRADAPEA